MTVKVRPYRRGGWEVDIVLTLDDGQTLRRRVKSPVASKSGSVRWGRERERHLIKHGPEPKPTPRPKRQRPSAPTSNTQPQGQPAKEVPTLAAFAPRYIEGYARANREKPSSIDSKGRGLQSEQSATSEVQTVLANLVQDPGEAI